MASTRNSEAARHSPDKSRQDGIEVCENNNAVISEQDQDFDVVSGCRERLKAEHRCSSASEFETISSPARSKRHSVGSVNFKLDCKKVLDVWPRPTKHRHSASTPKYRLIEPASSHGSLRREEMKKNNSLINASFDDSVFYSGNYEEVLETTRGLCRDYICYKLKRSGFRGRVVITKYGPAQDQNLSFDILKIGNTFESLYPHLFRNLARQLGYVLKSEHELRMLFDRLATNIIGPSSEDYTWARVLSLLGIAGALSVDCMAQGHQELIEEMVTIFCNFVEKHLLTWIMDKGGWAGMTKTFSEMESKFDQRVDFITRNMSKYLGPAALSATLVCLGAGLYALLSTFDISYLISKMLGIEND